MISISNNKKLLLAIALAASLVVATLTGFGMFVARPAGEGKKIVVLAFNEGYSLQQYDD